MKDALTISGLTKTCKDFVLNDVSFSVPSGSIVGLIGENGAGKSTTISAALGLVQKEAGSVSVLGKEELDNEVKEQIGVVFDGNNFSEILSPKKIGRVMRDIYQSWDGRTFMALLKKFSLPAGKPIKQFSKGMKMKLAIAVALSHNSKLLILDEATSGLDPVVRDDILDMLLDFVQDESHSILVSSHITSDLEQVADSIAYLHHGQLLFHEDKDTLLQEYGLLRCARHDLETLPPDCVVFMREGAFGCEALVKQRATVRRLLPGAVCDPAGIDDIMRYYSGRDTQ